MKNLMTSWIKGQVPEQHRPVASKLRPTIFLKTIVFSIFPILLCLPFFSQAQCSPNCQSINLSLEVSGYGLIDVATVLNGDGCSPTEFTLTITDQNGNLLPGNLIDCSFVGQSLTTRLTNNISGDWCEGSILVEDKMNPTISCQEKTIFCTSSADPEIIGYPEIFDNCSDLSLASLTYTDTYMDLACYTNHNGQDVTGKIKRVWTVSDDSGNTAQCAQDIYLTRITLSEVVFPTSLDEFDLPALDCGGDPNDLSVTGQPLVNGMPIEDGGGYCELIVNFTDQVVPICAPGSRKVVRTWSVIDMCSQQFILGAQTIKVLDQTPPVINSLNDLSIGMDTSICGARIFLPQTTATDDCSYYTITPQCAFGTGYGPFTMPVGSHIVTYVAEDDCGNTASTTMTVEVVDDVVPTAICDVNTTVALASFGTGVAYASTFDDGSHDNCHLASYKISRDGTAFKDSLIFNCEDIENSPIMIRLRVYDNAGNYNECDANVMVEELIRPVIGCPPNVTLECSQDYTDTNLTYEAIAYDNCAIDRVEYTDNLNLNNCNIGTIERTWTAYDLSGNTSICIQTITMEDPTPMIVSFPENKEYYTCGVNVDVSATGSPQLSNDCENVDVSFDDNIYGSEYPACYTITRTWSVINWCAYNSMTGAGYWEHVQEIYVYDTLAPVLHCPEDLTIGITAASCANGNISIPVVTATDCNTSVNISNNSPYAFANGANASGNYPAGEHTITYTASDGCGNTATCALQISVQDATPPTPVCITGITLPVATGGFVNINSSNLNFGSYDNCTDAADLDVQISRTHFSCADVGAHEVTMTVTDEAGNSATCMTIVTIVGDNPLVVNLGAFPEPDGMTYTFAAAVSGGSGNYSYEWDGASGATTPTFVGIAGAYSVTVTDLQGGCEVVKTIEAGEATYARIQGDVQLENGLPMDGVVLSLSGSLDRNSMTDATGKFTFDDVVMGGNYAVTPSYDGGFNAGITTFDLVLIGKHILGLQALDSPYKIIAADINKSGAVTTFDQVLIRKIILGQLTEIPGNTAWRFVCSNYNFDDPANPLDEAFAEVQEYTTLQTSELNTNFIAIKTGDVNGSVAMRSQELLERNNNVGDLNFVLEDKAISAGEMTTLAFRATDFEAISGFQFAFKFDPELLSFEGIEQGVLEAFSLENLGLKNVASGNILLSWNDLFDNDYSAEEILFNFKFKAKTKTKLSDAIQVDQSLMMPEAYAGIEEEQLQFLNLHLRFQEEKDIRKNSVEINVYPNPVQDVCHLSFTMPEAQFAQILFTDLQGRRLKKIEKQFEKGAHTLEIYLKDIVPVSTVVYCEVLLENGAKHSRKILVVQ